MKPSIEAINIKMNQHLLNGSPGSGIHTDDPQPPGSSMSPALDGFDWND